MKLAKQECELLTRLSTFVLWAGRYPVPKRRQHAKESRLTRTDDWEWIKRFVERLDPPIPVSVSQSVTCIATG